jgi:hypothetical protein
MLILASLWIASISFGRISVSMVATYFRYQLPDWTPFALAIGQGVFLISPLLLLASLWPVRRFAGIFRSWAAASALVLLLAPLHLTRPYLAQLQAVLHILLAGLYILLLVFLFQRRSRQTLEATPVSPSMSRQPAILSAALMAAVFAYPWLAWGALGSILDTLLQSLAALSLGLAAAVIVESQIIYAFRSSRQIGSRRPYPEGVSLPWPGLALPQSCSSPPARPVRLWRHPAHVDAVPASVGVDHGLAEPGGYPSRKMASRGQPAHGLAGGVGCGRPHDAG